MLFVVGLQDEHQCDCVEHEGFEKQFSLAVCIQHHFHAVIAYQFSEFPVARKAARRLFGDDIAIVEIDCSSIRAVQ